MNDQQKVEVFRIRVQDTWPTPTVIDSLRWTAQELFELDSVLMRLGYQQRCYNRNTPDASNLKCNMVLELGQCYLMLLTLSSGLGVDLSGALDTALGYQETTLDYQKRKLTSK